MQLTIGVAIVLGLHLVHVNFPLIALVASAWLQDA